MTEPLEPTLKIPYEKPLIVKRRFETAEELAARAEEEGIGRECLSCGAKRRFSKLLCHHCGSAVHRQCKVQSIKKDLDQSFEEAQQYHFETQMDTSKPTMSTFTPVEDLDTTSASAVSSPGADFSSQENEQPSEPTHDPDIDDGSPVEPPKQLDNYTRPELMKLVKDRGGSVTAKDTKSTLLEKYHALTKPEVPNDPDLN